MLKTLLATTLLAGLAATAAHATTFPTIGYKILDGSNVIGSGFSFDGTLSGSGSDSSFSVNLNATGAPYMTSPNFSTNDFSITKHDSSTGTLTIEITDINLPSYSGGNIANTFTLNSLNAPGFSTGTVSNYFDLSDAAYGTGMLLASSTFNGSNSFSSSKNTSVGAISSQFSETTIYTLTFTGSTSESTVSASSQLNSVPEPASLALVGGTLAAAGMIRRRKQA